MSSPLHAEKLSKVFRRVDALRDFTLEVPEGSVFALVGPNGAGKTTAMKTLLNMHPPTSGHATVLGVDSRRLGAEEFARIGYVSENQQMPGWMTVGYFLSYCKAFYPQWRDDDLAELIRLYELPLERKIGQLSRGMRVKAALASSLAYRPKLIVLDEPFGGLDVLVREQLVESILERTPESTIFLSSHDLGEIESFATHVAYLNEGSVQFCEEMAGLSSRFREVQVTLEQPVELPATLPSSWLNAKRSGVVVGFTDCRFESDRNRLEVQRVFPGVREVSARVMPLRAIMVAVAKSAKVGNGAR